MSRVSRAFLKSLKTSLLACFGLSLLTTSEAANSLEVFEGCTLVKTDWADGDSFEVKMPDGNNKVFRLYYVDCIETGISTTSDKRRLREQSRYFGLDDYRVAHEFGLKAKVFTQEKLSRPFTIHTTFADARGRSGKPRYYCFITTSEGQNLGQLLVASGYARAYGIGREMPDGTPRDEHESLLSDIELAAAIRREGAWSMSNPEAIVEMRKEERDEMRGLEAIDDAFKVEPPEEPIDLNTATLEELVSTGLRESLADAAIRMRPFKTVAELEKVKGIGPVTLAKVRPYLKVTPPAPL
ncbi:MAG: helix-hairpin-helix domain-containing protein [Verrucomicrobiales bacterium]|nr:helix-hairpin-helix domain-containing protein [Verrucomicrobiales bacterium]